jgi:hypothetical protein
MIADDRSDVEVAAFIRQNLRIVLLSGAECRQLDGRNASGFKVKMPSDWAFGGCAFERLTNAGIQWTPNLLDEGLAHALKLRWPQHMVA